MGIATLAISAKPRTQKIQVVFGSILIAAGAGLPSIDKILPDSFELKFLWIIPVISIIAALIGALLLQWGITYTRWAKLDDWKSADCVIVQGFIEGKDKGERP